MYNAGLIKGIGIGMAFRRSYWIALIFGVIEGTVIGFELYLLHWWPFV